MSNALTEIVANACQHCGKSLRGMTMLKRRKFCGRECSDAVQRGTGPARFWAKVDKNGPGGCWLYMGFRKWDGYGWLARRISSGKSKSFTAHRYAWILTHGEPPAGLHILHKCDVPACCNPDHLELGDHAANMADMKVKGRVNSGYLKLHKPVLYPDRVRPKRAA